MIWFVITLDVRIAGNDSLSLSLFLCELRVGRAVDFSVDFVLTACLLLATFLHKGPFSQSI